MPASNYVKQNTLSLWGNRQSVTPPAALYVALYSTNPTAADTGTEIAGGSYARASASFSTPSISGEQAIIQNTAPIEFPQLTASAGTAAYIGIRDARNGGNLLFFEALPTALVLAAGYTPYFVAGELKVSMK